MQVKADQLFQQGDYKRAHFIFLNELVPIGDKYAQYMVGFIHLFGLGVEEDPILASAWYRLAAERKTPEFIAVRDDLIRRLDTVEMQRSDELYSRLRLRYSDISVRMREVRKEFDRLHRGNTGSHTTGAGSPIMIIQPGKAIPMSSEAYKRLVERRIQKQLDYIVETLGIETVDADLTVSELNRLEEQVMAFAAIVDDL